MKVARWGNSLAIRIPAALAEALSLKEGDDVELGAAHNGFALRRRLTRDEAIARFRGFRGMMPEGYSFDRDEANER